MLFLRILKTFGNLFFTATKISSSIVLFTNMCILQCLLISVFTRMGKTYYAPLQGEGHIILQMLVGRTLISTSLLEISFGPQPWNFMTTVIKQKASIFGSKVIRKPCGSRSQMKLLWKLFPLNNLSSFDQEPIH